MSLKIFSTKKNIIYSVFIALTVLLGFIMFTWTLTEKHNGEVILYDTEVVMDDTAITEYIIGETVNTDGIKMYLDGKEVEFTAEADFSSAGIKEVKLTYEDENGKHVGNYPVNVYTVKHFDLRSFPASLYKTNKGYIMNGLTLWAALSDNIYSERFMLTPENPKWYNTVQLSNDVYKLDQKEDEKTGIVKTTVNFGSYSSVSFNSLVVGGGFDASRVNGAIKVMPLYNNDEENADRLTLFIKTATTNVSTSGRKMEATGVYVYENHSGGNVSYEYIDFSYWMDDFYGSHFTSSGITETLADDTINYFAEYNGRTFTAKGAEWRAAFIVV